MLFTYYNYDMSYISNLDHRQLKFDSNRQFVHFHISRKCQLQPLNLTFDQIYCSENLTHTELYELMFAFNSRPEILKHSGNPKTTRIITSKFLK